MSELNDTDERVLRALEEGRSTPGHLADELDTAQSYVSQRLRGLVESGHVRQVDRGLYELNDDAVMIRVRDRTVDVLEADSVETITNLIEPVTTGG